MPLALRYSHEPAAAGPPLSALLVEQTTDSSLMAVVQGVPETEIRRRFAAGHRAYLGWWDGWPAAWGWVATRTAEIGELGSAFEISDRDRYLWNFVTRAEHRGKGIYPRLLDAIVRAESTEAERFWIAYAPENHASGAGIHRAGFRVVAELSFDAGGRPAVRSLADGGDAAAHMLGLPLVEQPLAPCWYCARRSQGAPVSCADGECSCDYQKLRARSAA